jgi:NAD(P)-dependent dehydrogenase (short-subunit alcohol dehydrogenase family)
MQERMHSLQATSYSKFPLQCLDDEIAPLHTFLLSDESAYVTAQAYSIDGGVYN